MAAGVMVDCPHCEDQHLPPADYDCPFAPAPVPRGELRHAALERAGFRCEFPGCNISGDGNLEMAHLRGSGMGGSKYRDHIDNVVMLCRHHHDFLDGRTTVQRRLDSELLMRSHLNREWPGRR